MGWLRALNVVAGDQAFGLIFIVCCSLLFRPPPIIFGALFKDVEKFAFLDLEFTGALWLVIVDCSAYCHEAHSGYGDGCGRGELAVEDEVIRQKPSAVTRRVDAEEMKERKLQVGCFA